MNLITGATGLIGAHLALHLVKQNQTVVAIKRSSSDILKTKHVFSYYEANYENLFSKIKWIEADILDIYSLIDALDGIDTVYHCAGFVSFNSKESKLIHKINTEGTANIVNACLEKKINTLCFVSSIATLQNPDFTKNIDETVYWKSSPRVSNYAISKYNAEREVWRGNEEGLNTIIVNPGIVLGPGFWNQSSGKLASTCYKGLLFYTKGKSASIDVRDVVSCMVKLVNHKTYGKRFVLIEDNHSFEEILNEFHTAFGKKTPTIKAGIVLLTIAKWLDFMKSKITGTEQLITNETVQAGIDSNTFSNKLVKSTLNPDFIPLKKSAQDIASLYLKDFARQ